MLEMMIYMQLALPEASPNFLCTTLRNSLALLRKMPA